MKKIGMITGILCILAIIAVILLLPDTNTNKIPEPTIKEGEFPFILSYEIDGAVITVEDIYVCEYTGIEWNKSSGYVRTWKGYLKSNGCEGVFITEDDHLKVYCYVGDPNYYMESGEGGGIPHLFYTHKDLLCTDIMTEEAVKSKYRIKILSWDFSDPIANTFS